MGDRVQQDKKTVIHDCVQIPKNFQTMKEKATPSLNDPIKIGYFGGLKSAKRPFLFMEIASCLNNMGYDHFEFYFYGPEPPEGEVSFDQFSNYRDKLGLNSNLYYVGHVMEPVKHINQMDIILSLWPEEPFGRIPIEAVLCGAVAIVANSGGHQETVDDYVSGFKVSDYQNPQSYADKIIEVIAHFENNPDRFNEFLVNAKHAMKTKFQTQKFAAEIINLYTELTSLHP
jgi:glycosyltransferase involved in cell wall biosynthesis